ncbi:MAG TPA: histidine phosphatase family protein [Candidatus Limnocylindria bacterium]|nr:histidine phosphatase family protein [Candidatus Limnocylindria bacterium]
MTDARLIIVRHGVTDWNREGRFQGHLDPALSADGRLEAELVAERIAADTALRPARIISSPLARARETAEAIGRASGCAVEADPMLMEIGQGEWEGRTHAELAEVDADRYRAWRQATGGRQPPGGETLDSVTARARAALTGSADGPWPLCLVSHGGIIRVLAGLALDLDPVRAWALDVDNAALGVLAAEAPDAPGRSGGNRRWRLERWNDTLHLLGIEPTHVDEAEGRPLAL